MNVLLETTAAKMCLPSKWHEGSDQDIGNQDIYSGGGGALGGGVQV